MPACSSKHTVTLSHTVMCSETYPCCYGCQQYLKKDRGSSLSLCLCRSSAQRELQASGECVFLPACCFLATLMGAGGHQVAKTETATFNNTHIQQSWTQAPLPYFNSISWTTEDYGCKIVFYFYDFFPFLCNYEVSRSHDLSFWSRVLIIYYVLLLDAIKSFVPSWMFCCMFTCSNYPTLMEVRMEPAKMIYRYFV